MHAFTGLAVLALSSAAIAAPAVSPVIAAIPGNPGRPPRGYAFSVTNWEASCSIPSCAYSFTVTAPAVPQGATPAFPAINHQCSGTDNNFLVDCVPLGTTRTKRTIVSDMTVLSRLTPNNDSGSRLFIRLELPAEGNFIQDTQPAYYGRATAPDFDLTGVSFTVTPIREAPRMRQGSQTPAGTIAV